MPVTPPESMRAFVRQRIGALLDRPDAWGPPEAVELQLLLLLEMWQLASGASQEEIDGVFDRYQRHLGRAVPGPPASLSERLGLAARADERFVRVLREFVDTEFARQHDRFVLSSARAPSLPRRDQKGKHHLEA